MNENPHAWRKEYLARKAGLSKRQVELLEEGPHSLSQSWLLQAMYIDYKKIMGIKEPPSRESGYQTTLKEWFQKLDKE